MLMLLTDKLASLLQQGIKITGSYVPAVVLGYVKDYLTPNEFHTAEKFMTWVYNNNHIFDHNIREVFTQFIKSKNQDQDLLEATKIAMDAFWYVLLNQLPDLAQYDNLNLQETKQLFHDYAYRSLSQIITPTL